MAEGGLFSWRGARGRFDVLHSCCASMVVARWFVKRFVGANAKPGRGAGGERLHIANPPFQICGSCFAKRNKEAANSATHIGSFSGFQQN